MPEFPESLGLNLPDALPGDPEFASYFFKRPGLAVVKPEAEPQNPLFPLVERIEHLFNLLLEHHKGRSLCRRQGILVFNEVAEMAVLFLADRSLQRHRLLCDFLDLSD